MDNEVKEETINNPEPTPQVVPQNVTFQTTTVNIPEEYRPISMWGYFGYELLFSIPCIGFIILCVFALGGTRNINLKNFARSYFCLLIIGLILGLIIFLLVFIIGGFNTISYSKVPSFN